MMPVVLCIFILATKQDPHLDGDDTIGKERAFLLHISGPPGFLWCIKDQINVLVVSWDRLLASFSKQDPLLILENDWLCFVGMSSLNVCHLPGHLKKGSAKYFCPQLTEEESETR